MRENSQETKIVAQESKLNLKTFKDQNKISTRVNKFFASNTVNMHLEEMSYWKFQFV